MSQARNRIARMLERHPMCCFCGGDRPTETIEHAPPRVLFVDKKRPKGLEFPACRRCNNGSSQQDQVVALFTILMGNAFEAVPNARPHWQKLIRGVKNNTPEVIEWLTERAEDISFTRFGFQVPMVRVEFHPDLFRDFIYPWTAKQVIALWFEHTGRVFSLEQQVWVHWRTNYSIEQNGVPQDLLEMAPQFGKLRQGKLNSGRVFEYRYEVSPDSGLGLFVIALYDSALAIGIVYPTSESPEVDPSEDPWCTFSTSGSSGIVSDSVLAAGQVTAKLSIAKERT